MKKALRILAALALAFLMLAGDLAAAAAPGPAAESVRAEVLAKSRKKKKNTSGPADRTEQASPAPAEEELRESPDHSPTPVPEGPIIDPQSIADYIFSHGELPENFITKQEARELGWGSRYSCVSDAAPGKSIGGDHFGNYDRNLPVGKGISYREADCLYTGGKRNAYRIIYSSDGRVWYTEDHYNTFTELFPSTP